MTTHANFTGTPFIAGSIIGERCFDFLPGVALKSPLKPFKWTADENTAECLKADQTVAKRLHKGWPEAIETAQRFIPEWARVANVTSTVPHNLLWGGEVGGIAISIDWYSPTKGERGVKTVSRKEFEQAVREQHGHDFGTCSCGFYAYLNGYNEFASMWRITGIIEGYGDTFIGDRGFRSSKARILALSTNSWMDRYAVRELKRRYPDIPIFDSDNQLRRAFPPTDVSEIIGLRDDEEEA